MGMILFSREDDLPDKFPIKLSVSGVKLGFLGTAKTYAAVNVMTTGCWVDFAFSLITRKKSIDVSNVLRA